MDGRIAAVGLRTARPAEHDEVRHLLRAAYGRYAAILAPAVFQEYLADLQDLAGGGDPTTLVAVAGDRIVGTARLYPPGRHPLNLPGALAWVRAVATRPDLRGRGVASTLMGECAERAAAAGASGLGLHTTAFMTDAVRLYRRLGYTRVPEWDLDVTSDHDLPPDQAVRIEAYVLDLDGRADVLASGGHGVAPERSESIT